jgi:hypothetical protein
VGRIGGVEELEEFDEFAAAMTVPDQGMDLAGDKIDVASKLTVPWRLYSNSRANVACRPGSGGRSAAVVAMAWIARLLIVGDDRHRVGWLIFCRGGRRLQDFQISGRDRKELAAPSGPCAALAQLSQLAEKSELDQGPGWQGLHYVAVVGAWARFPGAVMRGGGCGGKLVSRNLGSVMISIQPSRRHTGVRSMG